MVDAYFRYLISQKFAALQILGLLEGTNIYSIQMQGCFKWGSRKLTAYFMVVSLLDKWLRNKLRKK